MTVTYTVDDMVLAMIDETECRAELKEVRSNLWRAQFRDAFQFPGGPAAYWQAVEKEWKDKTDGAPIPAKYRSNKSVILKAHKENNDLDIWTEGGVVIGKTAVERELKPERVDGNDVAQIIRIIERAYNQSGKDGVRQLCEDILVHVHTKYEVTL